MTQRFKIDILDNQTYEQIYVKQNTQGFNIEFEITKNDKLCDITGFTALFEMEKPNKRTVVKPCTISNNIVSIEIDRQMTDISGKANYQVTLIKGDVRISTTTNVMKIERSAISS
jgi:predicted aconitase